MLADTRLITASNGPHQAQAQRFEVMFADGSAIGLHPVVKDGRPSMFLRCVRQGAVHLIVFDLRDIVPASERQRDLISKLDAELRTTRQVDVPGFIFYTFRQHYKKASDALATIMNHPIDMLVDVGPQEVEAEAA